MGPSTHSASGPGRSRVTSPVPPRAVSRTLPRYRTWVDPWGLGTARGHAPPKASVQRREGTSNSGPGGGTTPEERPSDQCRHERQGKSRPNAGDVGTRRVRGARLPLTVGPGPPPRRGPTRPQPRPVGPVAPARVTPPRPRRRDGPRRPLLGTRGEAAPGAGPRGAGVAVGVTPGPAPTEG